MVNKPIITDEQLEKELEKGLTKKQIAEKHGYNKKSRQLTKRIRELGWVRNQKLSINSFGSANVSIPSEPVTELLEANDLSTGENGEDCVFVVPCVNETGNLEFVPTRCQFRKPEEEQ